MRKIQKTSVAQLHPNFLPAAIENKDEPFAVLLNSLIN